MDGRVPHAGGAELGPAARVEPGSVGVARVRPADEVVRAVLRVVAADDRDGHARAPRLLREDGVEAGKQAARGGEDAAVHLRRAKVADRVRVVFDALEVIWKINKKMKPRWAIDEHWKVNA